MSEQLAAAEGNPLSVPDSSGAELDRAESVLTHVHQKRDLPAETARRSAITQIYSGTNQIQRIAPGLHPGPPRLWPK